MGGLFFVIVQTRGSSSWCGKIASQESSPFWSMFLYLGLLKLFFCVFVECFVFVFPFIVVVKLTIKWKKKKRIIKWILDILIFFLMWRSASCLFKWLLLFDIRFWRFCFWILVCWSCEILNGKCPIRGCH